MNKYSLSVIMPALNEEDNIKDSIESTLKAIDKCNIDGEIIIVNDGSTDKTLEIVNKIIQRDKRIKLINHKKPEGIGYSFFDGAKRSIKDIVVMIPGDNENIPEATLAFFNLLEEVDIIIPFIHNIEVRHKGRRIISSIYRFIINISFGTNLNYTNGTVFYRRCILDDIKLHSFGFFYQTELLIKLIRKGYLFSEVPNLLSSRNSGKSKATTLFSLVRLTGNYLKLFYAIHLKRIESVKDYRKLNPHSISYKTTKKYGVSE